VGELNDDDDDSYAYTRSARSLCCA